MYPGTRRGHVDMSQKLRKVILIGAEAWARDTIRVLLGSLGCQCVMASSIQEALPVLEQEQPDAAIVDEQRAGSIAPEVPGIEEVCQQLRDRVILLTGGSESPEVPALTRGWWLPRIPRSRLLQDLWSTLNSLVSPYGVAHRVKHVAHIIFDNFVDPLPLGARGWHTSDRRILYEAGSLTLDLSLEPQTGSPRLVLVGQLTDGMKPDRRLDSLPVAVCSSKGRVNGAATNQFGEFRLEFSNDPGISLEIEIATNEFVSVVLPRPEEIENGFSGTARPRAS